MQPEAISAVRWVVAPGPGKGSTEQGAEATAGSLQGAGAHLTLSVPPVNDPAVHGSLTLRSMGESFSHGMRTSFVAQPMADMLAASKKSDTAAMTVALVRLTDASNSANLLMKMASNVNNGIKALTSQSG